MKKFIAILVSVFVLVSLCTAMAVPAMAATPSAEGEEVFKINVSSFADLEAIKPYRDEYRKEADEYKADMEKELEETERGNGGFGSTGAF